ncbi:STAS domain-containing protein [Streptomyces odonnellii]|uniref:STAS domain-containing protein n=1 Tax=Streptomyces odonnellii TaxID=1417980 RepID=UPI0006251F33|nr:STAS domain-containing protein [Streptomyces odonnellii]
MIAVSDEWRDRPRERVVGRTTLVELHGEIDVLTAPAISEYLDSLTDVPKPDLLIDLQHVSFLDCRGLSVLCRARRRIRERGGRLALIIRNPPIHRMLRITGLLDAFDVLDACPSPVHGYADFRMPRQG